MASEDVNRCIARALISINRAGESGVRRAIASAIIGGSIVASQRDYSDAWERCDDRYRSFRWSDGTFQPYGDDPRQLCPYLAR